MIRKLILSLGLAWAGFAALAELERALAGLDGRDRLVASAIGWRFGMPQVAHLERFLGAARSHLPRGSTVVFASPADGPAGEQQRFFRHRWAAYFLPEVDLVPLSEPRAGRVGQYLLAYRDRIDHPRLVQLRRLPGGRLYRIRP